MTIRFIGGLWRRIDGKNIRSFSTYQGAVDNKTSWEDVLLTSSDDLMEQVNKKAYLEHSIKGRAAGVLLIL